VDNEGEVKFVRELLTEEGNLQHLYNFSGDRYRIQEISGIVHKDNNSK